MTDRVTSAVSRVIYTNSLILVVLWSNGGRFCKLELQINQGNRNGKSSTLLVWWVGKRESLSIVWRASEMEDMPSTSRLDDVDMDHDEPDAHAPSTSSRTSGQAETGKDEKDGEKTKENLFECNICLDSPSDPVVSLCGHLFCWPCLHGWLEMRPEGLQTCPVCKAAITREKVIPLFGRHSKGEDPRNKAVPPRPQAQRTEQTRQANFNHNPDFSPFGFGGGNNGFHMTVGFGAFPFTFFAQTFGLLEAAHGAQQGLVSKIFLWVAVILIFALIFIDL